MVITVAATLQGFDPNLVRAAASLGSSPARAFRTVTLPIIAPGVVAGAIFAFATSFDELVVALFLSSPTQRTLPRQIFSGVTENISPTITAAAVVLLVISVLLMTVMELLRRRGDPNTRRHERFDPLLSTGLGIWLQGLNFGKMTSNANLQTHRWQFNVAPREGLNLTFDWHVLRAPELYNAGGNPAISTLRSHDIGQEFTLSARWSITRHVYLQSFVSTALPGQALREIGADRPWTTLQASVYWSL